MQTSRNIEAGFTLIELLVVILVVGILIAVAVSSFLGQQQKALDSEARQQLSIGYRSASASATERNGAFTDSSCVLTCLVNELDAGEPQFNGVNIASAPAALLQRKLYVISTGTQGRKIKLAWLTADDNLHTLSADNGNLTDASTPLGDNNSERIIFNSDQDGDLEIYTIKTDGSDLRKLTDNSSTDRMASWSPDRSKIVFASGRDNNPAGSDEVYTMNADGSGQTRLTTSAGTDWTPHYSPDGSSIAFTSTRTGAGDIYSMNADGSSQTRLTTDSRNELAPRWSPNGSRLTFVCNSSGGSAEVCTMNADGTNRTMLTGPDAVAHTHPSWSPDGSKIVFSSHISGTGQIYTMNPDGSGITQISSSPSSLVWPRYSPDGTKIAADSQSGDYNIVLMNADGSGLRLVPTGTSADYNGDW